MVDLYRNAERFVRAQAAVSQWPVGESERRVLETFVAERLVRRSPGRRMAQLCHLRRLFCGTRTGKRAVVTRPLAVLSLDDVTRIATTLCAEATHGEVSRATFKELRFLLKEVLRVGLPMVGRVDADALIQQLLAMLAWPPERVQNLSVARYYTYDEFRRILGMTRRPLERALLAIGWETTARPNEYLSLRVGDVTPTAHGFTLRAHVSKQLGGITRTRNLYVLAFRAEFAAFWQAHPWAAVLTAPLFYRDHCRAERGRPLGPAGANKILRKYDTLSGVNKSGTLYFLRHGGYTHKILQGMHPDLAGADMGWTPGSHQRQRYTHLTDHDVLRERLRLAGVRFESEVQPDLRARTCPYCNQANSPIATHCATCGQTLSLQDVLAELATLKANQAALVERTLGDLLARRGLEVVQRM